MVTWILWALILAMLAWMGFNYLRIRRAAKIVGNEEFEALIRTGQLIDLRDPAEFHRKHILGARNIPSVSYTHLRAHETRSNLVCRLLLEKKKHQKQN